MKINKKLFGGFQTFWIRYEEKSADRTQLFVKEHTSKRLSVKYPKGQTLFIANIPPCATKDLVEFAFSAKCGPVLSVNFETNRGTPGRLTYVVFENEMGLDKALSLPPDALLTLSSKERPLITGLKKWVKEYNDSIPNEEATKKQIEEFMSNYDKRVESRAKKQKLAEAEDSEGWVKITGKKKRGKFAPGRKESTINKLQDKLSSSNKKTQLRNFYPFQIREAKKQKLLELRKKFELDKQRFEQMKQNRSFKPF